MPLMPEFIYTAGLVTSCFMYQVIFALEKKPEKNIVDVIVDTLKELTKIYCTLFRRF